MLRRAKTQNVLSGRRSQRAFMEIAPGHSCTYPLDSQPRRVDVKGGRCTMLYGGKAREMGKDEFAVIPGTVEFTLFNPSGDTPVVLLERRVRGGEK